MSIEVGGKTIATDEEGFLVNLSDWSEDVAARLAAKDKLEMTETHWGLVDATRDFFEENQKHPSTLDLIHMLGKHLKKAPGVERHELDNFLYKLFPHGPDKQLAKIAGLPKPLPSSTEG